MYNTDMKKSDKKKSHKANYKDDMGKQPLGLGKNSAGDIGKKANKKASDSFKRV